MDFVAALEILNEGGKVRHSKLPENSFLYLVKGSTFQVSRPPLNSLLPEGTTVSYQAHIDQMTVNPDGTYLSKVYTMTNEDLFTDNWEKIP